MGANYRAACRGRSKAEFIAKMGIVAEEAAGKEYSAINATFDHETGELMPGMAGDTLADFVTREIADGFDPNASSDDQAAAAVRQMEVAVEDMQSALDGLANLLK